jgi:very-short-patch-repair endonuclease
MNSQWDALLRVQAMIFTLRQARDHGFTDHQLRWRVTRGSWQQIHPRIFVAHNGPLSYESRLWAAVLYAGEDAALCLGTAAHAWGLVTTAPATIHVVVEGSARRNAARGVRVHRTPGLPRREVFRSGDAPDRTSVERTVLDLIHRTAHPADVSAIVARSVQQGRTTGPRLAAALATRERLRHTRLVAECVELAGEGAHSVLEMRHAQLHRRHGLPVPTRQRRHVRPDRSWYLDAVYEAYGLAVELDGRLVHTSPAQWWADMDRDNQLQVDGYLVQRFPGFVILSDPCRVAADLARALVARGWPGPFRRCPRCP